MLILLYVVLGFSAGFYASKRTSKFKQSSLVHSMLGIFGAVSAGWLYCCLSLAPGANGLTIFSIFVAIIGAAGLLVLYEMLVHGDI
jgi:uncharacterized membrane protein YeaQ/YmgE (transglycosylase-associated protein family)